MPDTTLDWRIFELTKAKVIERIGRGKYVLPSIQKPVFIPAVPDFLQALYHQIHRAFPYLELCVWHTSLLNEFMLHQPVRFLNLIEVPKESMRSVFYFLKDLGNDILLEPDEKELSLYAENEMLVIRHLVSEAPLQEMEGTTTVSLEKVLVDLYYDTKLFASQQGSERDYIFKEALGKYTIHQNKLWRYAARRGSKKEFQAYSEPFFTQIIKV